MIDLFRRRSSGVNTQAVARVVAEAVREVAVHEADRAAAHRAWEAWTRSQEAFRRGDAAEGEIRWAQPAATPLDGCDDGLARRRMVDERDRSWHGRPMAVGRENRVFCDAIHRGRWPR